MNKLETTDWIILNNIIYTIHTSDNFDEMRLKLLEELKPVMDYDSADFFLASREEEHFLCRPVTYNCETDLTGIYEELDYSRGMMLNGKTQVYRATDIVAEEDRGESDFYRKVLIPNNWNYALQIIIARHKRFLGVITFYRATEKEDFQHEDVFVLDMLKDHLAYRMEKHILGMDTTLEKLTISDTISKYDLSKRESTVLKELMSGKSNNDICEELFITANTLKKHILNIYRKLGIKNRVQLFKMVRENE